MAQLPTPTVSGAFNAANTAVSGTVTWASASNLTDLNQVRVRYCRLATSRTKATPNRSQLMNTASNRNPPSSSWRTMLNASGQSTNYSYKDDVITSGFSTISPFSDRSVTFSEAGLSGYYCWAMARNEA